VIALRDVAARRRPLALSSLSHVWDAGSHAIVGAPADGGPLLLALIAGLLRPRSGSVRVLDAPPVDPAVRRQIAIVPLQPVLPEAMRVHEVLDLAAVIRKEAPRGAAERLAALGVGALAERRVRTLSRGEARAVALSEALTSPTVRVLLVEEPLVSMDARATGHVPGALRARGRDGRAVVLTTASMKDASELADDWVGLRAGAIVQTGSAIDALVEPGPQGTHLRVVLRRPGDVPALVAALAQDADVDAIERDQGCVQLRGRDAAALARAAGRAALAADVDVAELRIDPIAGMRPAPGGAP
jgi:ABC-type multidrug transport system ATPase subunit